VTQYAIEEGWLDPSILNNPCKDTSRPQLRHWSRRRKREKQKNLQLCTLVPKLHMFSFSSLQSSDQPLVAVVCWFRKMAMPLCRHPERKLKKIKRDISVIHGK